MRGWKSWVTGAVIFGLAFFLIYFRAFFAWDNIVTDFLCQTGYAPSKDIYIIAIDDKTLEKYGTFSQWSREKSRELVEILNRDREHSPSVIGFDVLFVEDGDSETDAELARACSAGNVVTAMNLTFREMPDLNSDGSAYYDSFHIQNVNYPYDALREAADYGFVNTIVDRDACVRQAMSRLEYENGTLESFDIKILKKYSETLKNEFIMPITDTDGLFHFSYSSPPGGYSVISLCDVLEGRVNANLFQDAIVLVGAYAEGMQDAYTPAIAHNQQMFGVEIHANIINSIMADQTKREIPVLWAALLEALLAAGFFAVCIRVKPLTGGILLAVSLLASVFLTKAVYSLGYIIPLLVFCATLLIVYVYSIFLGYVLEKNQRQKVLKVFKQYIAPQVVEEISKNRGYEVSLGGERRHVAVLFVDIRGFTSISERLEPEQVVEMLNEYLSLTTNAIFKYSGTLDKFIGDATMAVFNAPFDLQDYALCAAKAAWDIKQGASVLSEKYREKYGRDIEVGIGINCGDAVVGNIGCDFRMDYTAIGDTVNVASRLEGAAKPGQILVSPSAYDMLKDVVSFTEIGTIPLKGKEKGLMVYQIDSINDPTEEEKRSL